MGSCVSRSPASASVASGRAMATAKVGLDGCMAQYAAPVTAREVVGGDAARASSLFLCSSDELRFNAPPRALADKELLQPGWLYFVLPVSMLRLALSGHEMAALAVRASTALAVASGVVASPPHSTNLARANIRHRKTARVAPLVAPDEGAVPAGGGDEMVEKAWKRCAYRSRGARHRRRAGVERLSVILEADEF